MIKTVIFDLDGTLIQTEVLKANSYAIAIHELTKGIVEKKQVLEVFNQFVGLSRREVVMGLSNHFTKHLQKSIQTTDIQLIGKKVIEKRLKVYHKILDDSELLSEHFCPYTLDLFHSLKQKKYTLVLATMSHLPEAKKVTEAMHIYEQFELILTKDDVEHGKPAPDIYLKVLELLHLDASKCLVIEDSPNGILAAQNANISVFAVTNDITRKAVHDCKLLREDFIVDDLSQLKKRVFSFVKG